MYGSQYNILTNSKPLTNSMLLTNSKLITRRALLPLGPGGQKGPKGPDTLIVVAVKVGGTLVSSKEVKQMKASVGRIVHYVEPDRGFHWAAMITEVHEEGVAASVQAVSLAVFEPTGVVFLAHIPYKQSGLLEGTWHWPERVE